MTEQTVGVSCRLDGDVASKHFAWKVVVFNKGCGRLEARHVGKGCLGPEWSYTRLDRSTHGDRLEGTLRHGGVEEADLLVTGRAVGEDRLVDDAVEHAKRVRGGLSLARPLHLERDVLVAGRAVEVGAAALGKRPVSVAFWTKGSSVDFRSVRLRAGDRRGVGGRDQLLGRPSERGCAVAQKVQERELEASSLPSKVSAAFFRHARACGIWILH